MMYFIDYHFGMPMPGRTMSGAEGYRYAFQGQEKDPETGKEAFELRLWDSRIGRWLTTDPYGQYSSPYLGMGNNPISRIDPNGGIDTLRVNSSGYIVDKITAPGDNVFIDDVSGNILELNDPQGFDKFLATANFEVGDRLYNPITFNQALSIIDITNLRKRSDAVIDLGAYFNAYGSSRGGEWDYRFNYFWENRKRFGLNSTEFDYGSRVKPEDTVHFIAFRFGNHNTLYNVADASQFLWGFTMFHAGFSRNEAWFGSNANEFLRGGDDAADQRAIFNGYRYRGY